jgi:hypothetical protein
MRRFHLAVTEGLAEGFEEILQPAGTLSIEEALGVYRRGYFARLTESLGETYRSVWRVLGDESFFAVCGDFIEEFHSKSWNLSDFGPEFPGYLSRHPISAKFPFLSDLAHVGIAIRDVFHRTELVGVEPAIVARALEAGRDEELRLIPGIETVLSPWAIFDLWRATEGESGELPDYDFAQGVIVFRRGGQVQVHSMTEGQLAILAGLGAESAHSPDAEVTDEETSALFGLLARERLLVI